MRICTPASRSLVRGSASRHGQTARHISSASQQTVNKSLAISVSCALRNQHVQASNKRHSSSHSNTYSHSGTPSWIYLGAGVGLLTLAGLVLRPRTATEAPAAPVEQKPRRIISGEELAKHTTKDSLWVVISGQVWDVTEWAPNHPGGPQYILSNGGRDVTSAFVALHPAGTLKKSLREDQLVGDIDPAAKVPRVNFSPEEVSERREALPELETIVNLNQFEEHAQYVLGDDSIPWRYFSSAADACATAAENIKAWTYLRFVPRVNIDVTDASPGTNILGGAVPFPFFFAPTGSTGLADPDGELNVTRAAAATGIPQCVSSVASKKLRLIAEERDRLAAEGKGRARLWFQLYIRTDRRESEKAIQEAADLGCEAVLITVDTPTFGKREADVAKVAGDQEPSTTDAVSASALTSKLHWEDIDWVRKHAPKCKVLVKGVQSVDDCLLAKAKGADGIILSNHGGRQLDFAPPGIAVLARLRLEQPDFFKDKERFSIFVDGGVRRGTDILKAVALGANGCAAGRPMLYANASYGAPGIHHAAKILGDEVKRGMMMLGATRVNQLKPEHVELMDGLLGKPFKS